MSREQGQDPFKHRQGPIRKPRINEWYRDTAADQSINTFFTGAKGGVPNNPLNYGSFIPSNGEYVFRTNPYGDGENIFKPEQPFIVKPDQWGDRKNIFAPAKGFDQQPNVGWGTPAKGMNTGISPLGSGPQRDVPKKSDKEEKKNQFSLGGGMPVGAIGHETQRGSWENAIAQGLRDPNQRVVGR